MAGCVNVDLEALSRAATSLGQAADDFDTQLAGFTGNLGGVGDPWGADDLGTLIGGGYVAVEQLALETFASVVDALDGVVDGIKAMVDGHAANDVTGATGIASAGEGLGA